jgi:hypothetical protein
MAFKRSGVRLPLAPPNQFPRGGSFPLSFESSANQVVHQLYEIGRLAPPSV